MHSLNEAAVLSGIDTTTTREGAPRGDHVLDARAVHHVSRVALKHALDVGELDHQAAVL